jgi:hypothetical protein
MHARSATLGSCCSLEQHRGKQCPNQTEHATKQRKKQTKVTYEIVQRIKNEGEENIASHEGD